MPYSSVGVSTKEEAKQLLDPIAKQYQAIKGIDYSLDYGEDAATESLTIDYSNLDYDAAKQLLGSHLKVILQMASAWNERKNVTRPRVYLEK